MLNDLLFAAKQAGIECLVYLGIPLLCWVCSRRPNVPSDKYTDPMGVAQAASRKEQ